MIICASGRGCRKIFALLPLQTYSSVLLCVGCFVQVSKGLSLALQALWAQQTGRGVLKRLLDDEQHKTADLSSSLEERDAQVQHLDAIVSCMLLVCRHEISANLVATRY